MNDSLFIGQRFGAFVADPDDVENVVIIGLTNTHALLDSGGDMSGWRTREYVVSAIALASEPQPPHMPR